MPIAFYSCALLAALTPPSALKSEALTRRAALLQTSSAALAFAAAPLALADDEALPPPPPPPPPPAPPPVMRGVLQMDANIAKRVPAGSTATVVVRVVGRNTGGPLATLTLPVADGSVFPLEYSVTRGDLREGLPDYIWEAEDIYVKADLTAPSGKEFAVGRGKSKFKDNEHQISYVLLE